MSYSSVTTKLFAPIKQTEEEQDFVEVSAQCS